MTDLIFDSDISHTRPLILQGIKNAEFCLIWVFRAL